MMLRHVRILMKMINFKYLYLKVSSILYIIAMIRDLSISFLSIIRLIIDCFIKFKFANSFDRYDRWIN